MAVLSLVSTQHPFIPDERNLPRGPVVSSLIRNPAPSSRHPATRSLVPNDSSINGAGFGSGAPLRDRPEQKLSNWNGMCLAPLPAALLRGAGFVGVARRLKELLRAKTSRRSPDHRSLHRESLRDRRAVSRAEASPPYSVQRVSAPFVSVDPRAYVLL